RAAFLGPSDPGRRGARGSCRHWGPGPRGQPVGARGRSPRGPCLGGARWRWAAGRSLRAPRPDAAVARQGAGASGPNPTASGAPPEGALWVLRLSNLAALGLPLEALDENQTGAFVG